MTRAKTRNDQIGNISWNDQLLWSKIDRLDDRLCWPWLGFNHPAGGLFGVNKNGHQQMTQARRVAYMSYYRQDITLNAVRMTCNDRACCNPHHMRLEKNCQQVVKKKNGAQPVSRPKPQVKIQRLHNDLNYSVLVSPGYWVLTYQGVPSAVKTVSWDNRSKYPRTGFNNQAHAYLMAERLNEIFETEDFAVLKLI